MAYSHHIHFTSVENLRNKSVSIAIANCAARAVPNAGINLVLLDPGVGYLETVTAPYDVTQTVSCVEIRAHESREDGRMD